MKLAQSAYKILFITFKIFLGIISRFVPRNEKLWVFGTSGKDVFWENPKYFFLYVSNEKSSSDIRPVWIGKSREMVKKLRSESYEAYYYKSLKGVWFSLRSSYSFVSHDLEDIHYGLTLGSKIINLHHGSPLKRISWDNTNNTDCSPWVLIAKFIYQALYYQYDRGIITGDYLRNTYLSAEFIKTNKFVTTGQPRNDLFFHEVEDWDVGADVDAVAKMSSSDRTNVMYLPTWRSYDEYSFEDIMNLERMDEWAEVNDANVIFKLHPSSDIDEDAVKDYDNLWLMQQSVDLQPLLKETDILISDYSSVHNDFLLLDRPIVFYPFDKARYKENRGFVRDYDYFTPGPKSENFDELLENLNKTIDGEFDYSDERKEIRDKLFDHQDGNSAERVWNMIMEM